MNRNRLLSFGFAAIVGLIVGFVSVKYALAASSAIVWVLCFSGTLSQRPLSVRTVFAAFTYCGILGGIVIGALTSSVAVGLVVLAANAMTAFTVVPWALRIREQS